MKMKLIAIGAVTIASLTISLQSFAGAGAFSTPLYPTNYLTAGSIVTGYPTNQITTNASGTWTGTGTEVYIGYVDHIGLNFQGFIVSTNTNAVVLYVQMIPSQSGVSAYSLPLLNYFVSTNASGTVIATNSIYSTNSWGITQNDWSTQPTNASLAFTFTFPTNAAGGGITNWFNFQTNLTASSLISDASFIGIWQISNNLSGAGSYITNFQANVSQKLLVKPLSP